MPTREVKVIAGKKSGQTVVQHFVATAADKKVLTAEVSKYVQGLPHSNAVTIVKK